MTALAYRHADRLWPAVRPSWPAIVRRPYAGARRLAERQRPRRRKLGAPWWLFKVALAALAALLVIGGACLALLILAWLSWPVRAAWAWVGERGDLRRLNAELADIARLPPARQELPAPAVPLPDTAGATRPTIIYQPPSVSYFHVPAQPVTDIPQTQTLTIRPRRSPTQRLGLWLVAAMVSLFVLAAVVMAIPGFSDRGCAEDPSPGYCPNHMATR